MKTLKLRIFGMHCESCEITLKRALSKLDNIKNINLNYNNEIVEIKSDSDLDANSVIETIRKVGYDASLFDGNKITKPKFNHYVKSLFDK